MTMISYAQNWEDVLVRRLFPEPGGFYIDIGANDPVHDSMTKHFYDHGWNGVNIEPIPYLYDRHCVQRTRDVNLNVGLSNADATLDFFEFPAPYSGLSTFSRGLADDVCQVRGIQYDHRTVPVMTLTGICEKHANRQIQFMSIDVEGLELEVLQGGDWQRWRPRLVVMENVPWVERWEPYLLGFDYHLAVCNGINRFYLRAEDALMTPLIATPVNVMDDFLPYRSVLSVEQLRNQLADYVSLGPNSLLIAQHIHKLAIRFPRVAAIAKRLIGATRRRRSKAA